MSDMPSPSTPLATDHERHDALLVAQLAAGDRLEPGQLAEAQRLVSVCGACAALAADLRVVSALVAQEPAPPRRRDFRLSPDDAERLSGNALTRGLRRLSLPSSRAFQPVAAGALSLGLAFLVVGYAWPEDGVVSVQGEPNYATYAQPSAVAPAAEPLPSPAPESLPDDALAAGAAERFSADPEFLEELAEHQSGDSARSNQKSIASEAADESEMRLEAEEMVAELAAPKAAPADGGLALDEEIEADADAATADMLGEAEEPIVGVTDDLSANDAVLGQDQMPPIASQDAVPEAASSTGDDDLLDLLIMVGLVLALGGGGLLLFGWLVRRTRDPLLR